MKLIKTFSVKIKDSPWRYRLLTDEYFTKLHGEGADAVTSHHNRRMDFRPGALTQGTVRHEILHAFVGECRVNSSELSGEQMEELICELMDHDFDKYNSVCNRVYTNLDQANKAYLASMNKQPKLPRPQKTHGDSEVQS